MLTKSCEVAGEALQSSRFYLFYLFMLCSAYILGTKKYVTKICLETTGL